MKNGRKVHGTKSECQRSNFISLASSHLHGHEYVSIRMNIKKKENIGHGRHKTSAV